MKRDRNENDIMKSFKEMSYNELVDEIARVKTTIAHAKSLYLVRDYRKYLQKLIKEKNDYERFNGLK